MKEGSLDNIETDVLIIGAGGAGMRAAIEVSKKGVSCILLGKSLIGKAHTVMAEGGINAALGNVDKEDNWLVHAKDTIKEGIFLNNPKLVEIMAKEAHSIILELENLGAIFDRTEEGKIAQRAFGAQTYKRTCHIADRTGLEIMNVLSDEIYKRNIKTLDEIFVTSLISEKNKIVGATAIDLRKGKFLVFSAKSVILATGGYGRVYKVTTNAWENIGDGVAMAFEIGASLMDMEMMQFHPTGMIFPETARGILVTESVRGDGGLLYNTKGERFMKHYDKERMELSARDVIARAIYHEIKKGNATKMGGVFLDISYKGKHYINKKLPKMIKQFRDFADVDITKEKMEVAPSAHYSMGGVFINEDCSTTIEGLYSAGEVVSGVHGANRLGGNSLLDILVFGKIAGNSAAEYSKKHNALKIDERQSKKEYERVMAPFKDNKGFNPFKLKEDIQKIMWDFVGIARKESELKKALKEILEIENKIPHISIKGSLIYNPSLITALDIQNMVTVCKLIILSALERKESRGAHYREDYPKTDDKNFLVNIFCTKKRGRIWLEKKYVPPLTKELEVLKNEKN